MNQSKAIADRVLHDIAEALYWGPRERLRLAQERARAAEDRGAADNAEDAHQTALDALREAQKP